MVAHTWKGISDFEINKAKELAKLGYAGLAIDIFGNGVNGKNIEENQALIKPFVFCIGFLELYFFLFMN